MTQAEKGVRAKQTTYIRWALVKLDEHRLVSVNFTLPVEAPGDRDTYVKLTERIVETIRPRDGATRATPR